MPIRKRIRERRASRRKATLQKWMNPNPNPDITKRAIVKVRKPLNGNIPQDREKFQHILEQPGEIAPSGFHESGRANRISVKKENNKYQIALILVSEGLLFEELCHGYQTVANDRANIILDADSLLARIQENWFRAVRDRSRSEGGYNFYGFEHDANVRKLLKKRFKTPSNEYLLTALIHRLPPDPKKRALFLIRLMDTYRPLFEQLNQLNYFSGSAAKRRRLTRTLGEVMLHEMGPHP